MTKLTTKKRPKPYRREMLGILNPYGDIWTSSTFETEDAARKYIADFWRGTQGEADIDRFKVVPVVVRVSAILSLEQGETAP